MFTIYSKGESCPFCVRAKSLLNAKKQEFKEILFPDDISKEDFLAVVEPYLMEGRSATFPQIFRQLGDEIEYIGGFEDLKLYCVSTKL